MVYLNWFYGIMMKVKNSSNPGIFTDLVKSRAELDETLKSHLEKATVFKGTFTTTQNKLLQVMLELCHKEVAKEIECTFFIRYSG